MSALITVRFPSGETEHRMSDHAPRVGDVLKRNGSSWVVDEVVEEDGASVVTLRAGLDASAVEPAAV